MIVPATAAIVASPVRWTIDLVHVCGTSRFGTTTSTTSSGRT